MSLHAIERAKERYGATLTHSDIERMEDWIASDNPRAIRLLWNREDELWAIRYVAGSPRARWFAAVVFRGRIITFIPDEKLRRRFLFILSARRLEILASHRPIHFKSGKDSHAG